MGSCPMPCRRQNAVNAWYDSVAPSACNSSWTRTRLPLHVYSSSRIRWRCGAALSSRSIFGTAMEFDWSTLRTLWRERFSSLAIWRLFVPFAYSSRIVVRCDWLSMLFLDLLQQPRGVLDFVADVAGVYGSWLSRCALERPPGDGGDLIEIAFQRGFRCCFPLALFRLEKQLRLGENPLAGLPGSGIAPGVVEQLGLPRGPVLLREDLRHP